MPNAPPQPGPASSSAKTDRRHSEEPRDEPACRRQGICFCFVVRTVAKPNVTLTQRRDIVRFGGRANVGYISTFPQMPWLEQTIRRYEHRRWAAEPNRPTLPFA